MISDTSRSALSNPTKYLPYASAFALASGLCYLWGYWGGFHIKILEHIEISSVIKLAVVPLAIFLVMSVTTAVLSERLAFRLPSEKVVQRTSQKEIGLFLKIMICGLIAFATFGMFYGTAWRWLALMNLGAPPLLLIIILKSSILRLLPTSNRFLQLMSASVIAMPFQCYGVGAFEGETIRDGTRFEYVFSGIEGYESLEKTQVQARLRIIGRASDYMFLFDAKESAVVMLKLPSDKILVIKNYDGQAQRLYLRKPFFNWVI